MKKVLVLTMLLILLNLRLIDLKANAEEYKQIDYDQEATTAITYNAEYDVEGSTTNPDYYQYDDTETGIDKSDTGINDTLSEDPDDEFCESCNGSANYSRIIKICVNYFPLNLTVSPTITGLWESDWVYNNGELTKIICTVGSRQTITMSYYEYKESSLKKVFTTTAIGTVTSYVKLEKRNSPAYIECKSAVYDPWGFEMFSSIFGNDNHNKSSTAQLFLIPSKRSKSLVKVNGLTLPKLCTNLQTSVYEYYAVMNEPIFIILRPNNNDIYCNTNGYKLSNSVTNITSFSVGFVFDKPQSIYIDCYRKSNVTMNRIYHNKTYEVVFTSYDVLFHKIGIWIEGLKWQFTLGVYWTYNQLIEGTKEIGNTKVIKYLYHGEELELICYAYTVPNWVYSDKLVYKQMNNVKQNGFIFVTTVSFIVKEYYSNVEISCTNGIGNIFTVEFIREESDVERNVVDSNSYSNDESSNVQTITISVTVVVAIIMVVFSVTVYKMVKVRNKRKLEHERIAANAIIYEPKYAENVYESVKYENPKRDNQSLLNISQRPPMPIPSEEQKEEQPSVDISQRPPLPLPLEEEDNQPYKHYDTPYEYRLFRFGRRTGPPNRSRTMKQIQ